MLIQRLIKLTIFTVAINNRKASAVLNSSQLCTLNQYKANFHFDTGFVYTFRKSQTVIKNVNSVFLDHPVLIFQSLQTPILLPGIRTQNLGER